MHIITDLNNPPLLKKPIVFAIGNFDGVHLGHQAILKQIKVENHLSGVITFTNHPSEVLNPNSPTPLICTIEHKKKLLKEAGIDLLVLIEFTKEFANQTSDTFLTKLHHALPFSCLHMGYDGRIGKNREGNFQKIQELGKKLQFKVEQGLPFKLNGETVSSSTIRHLIKAGNFAEIEPFLGRPYSIYEKVSGGKIPLSGLCLPPDGLYKVKIINGNDITESRVQLSGNFLKLGQKDHFVEVVFNKIIQDV